MQHVLVKLYQIIPSLLLFMLFIIVIIDTQANLQNNMIQIIFVNCECQMNDYGNEMYASMNFSFSDSCHMVIIRISIIYNIYMGKSKCYDKLAIRQCMNSCTNSKNEIHMCIWLPFESAALWPWVLAVADVTA